jgi:hypothetical protein
MCTVLLFVCECVPCCCLCVNVYCTAVFVWNCTVFLLVCECVLYCCLCVCVLYCCLCVNVYCTAVCVNVKFASIGISGHFSTNLTMVSPCYDLSFKTNANVYSQGRGTARTLQFAYKFFLSIISIFFLPFLIFLCVPYSEFCVLLCVNVYCCHRVWIQFI